LRVAVNIERPTIFDCVYSRFFNDPPVFTERRRPGRKANLALRPPPILGAVTLSAALFILHDVHAATNDVCEAESPRMSSNPIRYRDPKTGMVLCVEDDGRHVIATLNGRDVLWRADPFTAAELKPYRVARPRITYIGNLEDEASIPAGKNYAALRFDSTQFGIIDLQTGIFIFQGQD
jgi:hypothetical protein